MPNSKKLKDSEMRYRRLFESAQDGILILNAATGMIDDVNPYLIRMLGYSREEFVEKKLWEVGAFKDVEASKVAFDALQEQEYIRYEDLPLKAKDGRLIQVEFVSNVYRVDGAKVIQCNIRDISAHKAAERSADTSQERYRSTLNNMMEACQIIDYDWRYIYVNDAAAKQGRKAPVELLMHTMMEVYPGIEDTELFHTLQLSMENRISQRVENQFVFEDGSSGWFELSIQPVPEGIFILSMDVTERKRAEEALHESDENYRRIVETAQEGIWTVDAAGRTTLANQRMADMFGYTIAEMLDKSVEEFVDEEGRTLAPLALENRRNGINKQLDFKFKRKDGSTVWALVETSTLLDGYQVYAGALDMLTDISARKQVEESLRLSEEKYRTLVDEVNDGFYIVDAAGVFTFANPALARIYGVESPQALLGRKFLDFIAPENTAKIGEQRIQTMHTERAPEIINGQIVRPDGNRAFVEIKPTSIVEAGQITGSRGVVRDITQRKQAETEMRQRLRELELLYQSILAFSQLASPKAIAEKIIDLLDQKMDWHHTAIRLYDPKSETFELLAFHLPNLKTEEERSAAQERFRGMRRSYQGLSGWVIQHGESVLCDDLPNDERYLETFPGLQSGLYAPIKTSERVIGVISIESERAGAFSPSDERMVMTLATQAAIALDNAQLLEGLQRSNNELTAAYDATIEGWSRALDLRDKETEGHTQRVTGMMVNLARAFGLNEAELVQVRWGALLHDIGKLGVPDGILLKSAPLTDEEWVVMKKHPTFAYEMLAPIHYLRQALDIPYCHHEKWDGSGYPRGLKGDQIPLVARLFAIVDVWDALCSDRPYRAAWTAEKALDYIRGLAGTQFDPQVVEAFMRGTYPPTGGVGHSPDG